MGLVHAHGSSVPAKKQATAGLQRQKGMSAAVGVLLTPAALLGHQILKIKKGKKFHKWSTYLIMTKQHILINGTKYLNLRK